jgi:hypothetical protein
MQIESGRRRRLIGRPSQWEIRTASIFNLPPTHSRLFGFTSFLKDVKGEWARTGGQTRL